MNERLDLRAPVPTTRRLRVQLEQLAIAGLTADQWLVAALLVCVQHYALERNIDLRTLETAEIIAWARRATRAEA